MRRAGVSCVTRRPVVRYYGGKAALAPWIIAHMPPHDVYVEPFGGGAAVLLQKSRAATEVYNDLDGEMVNLFEVLRDREQGERLVRLVALTPFAREEFLSAYEATSDPVERARRLLVRSHLGYGGAGTFGRKTGFRPAPRSRKQRGTHPAEDWARFPRALGEIVRRCESVVIEHCDALELVRRYDGPDTVYYVDPPYLKGVRGDRGHLYVHDLEDSDHVSLAAAVKRLSGTVLLSGSRSCLYDELYADWHREERWAVVQGGGRRCEVLWMNRCPPAPRLFAGEPA